MRGQSTSDKKLSVGIQTDRKYRIGQLARIVTEMTGLSCTPAMIYNYESKGLLEESERTEGGSRLFDIDDVKRVACIKNLQEEGKSLKEIGDFLEECPGYVQEFEGASDLLETKRNTILQAARKIFPEKGYAASTLADIADEAGLSSAAIYQYFDSKEALFRELIEGFSFKDVLEDLVLTMENQQIKSKESIQSSLLQLAEAYIDMHSSNQELFRLFIAETREFPEIGKKYNRQLVKPLEELTERFIRLAMEQGLFRQVNPKLATHAFYGMFLIFHVTQDLLEGEGIQEFPEMNRTEELVDIYLSGLLSC
ncbi:MAG: TetR family transcriptional regulator [Anaerolineales bacterium]|nr:TetR family transcriptional regulator [Anaerolineales bacterium]